MKKLQHILSRHESQAAACISEQCGVCEGALRHVTCVQGSRHVASRAGALRRVVLISTLAILVALTLCSCRPTDFFTEVIITPLAEEVDEDNPQSTIINSPDAEEESDELSALDWSSDAEHSSEVQNVITYSPDPTTNMQTHHSLFDLNPRFLGALSSDAVQLDFTQSSTLESDSALEPELSDESTDTTELDGSQAETEGDTQTAGPGDDGAQTDEGPEGDQAGNDETAGYDGNVTVYDPNNSFSKVNHANQVAATGQAAVLVQMIGGAGALCAMDEDTYYGTNSDTVSNFKTVFSKELSSDFETSALLWTGEGGSSSDVKDIDALVSVCKEGGVILYDQKEGSWEERFDLEQRKKLQAANIELVPLDFSTVQGMLDAASVIGEALSESTECALNAQSQANLYVKTVGDIVSQAATSHGGTLASRDDSTSGNRLLTTYNSCPVSTRKTNHTFVAFGTSYVTGISYSGNAAGSLDTTGGLLFSRVDGSTPLSFWAQAAGVWDRAADASLESSSTYAMLYGIETGAYYDKSFFASSSASSVLSHCTSAIILGSEDHTSSTGQSNFGDGLGSASFPYLIVSGSNGKSADTVKQSVVQQMASNDPINAYSILPWREQAPAKTDENGNLIVSIIGSTTSNETKSTFLDQGVSASETVRANPAGLLGSWTEGSPESVLESVWLARIYSAAPANSSYTPLCNLSESELAQTVTSFYETFYRTDDTSALYNKVVADKGL